MNGKQIIHILALVTTMTFICIPIQAQQGLHIASVFQKYGRSKGATLTVLSNGMLDAYEMKLYKSISLRSPSPEVKADILNSLSLDKKKAKKIKEVVNEGELLSGYYQLPQEKQDINRFILYKNKREKNTTLIYIEGELDAEDLVTLLFMKQ